MVHCLTLQSSYSFRTYFLRRSRDMFRANLYPASQASTSSPFSKVGSSTTHKAPQSLTSATAEASAPEGATRAQSAPEGQASAPDQAEQLRHFFGTATKDLHALKRAAIVNRMYAVDSLVVEEPYVLTASRDPPTSS